jgi:predicted MFS family arabinose efflux permease
VIAAPAVLPDSRGERREGKFDTTGAVVLTGGLLLLIHTLNEAVTVGWQTPRTIGGLAAAAVLLGAFTAVEARAASPLLPLGVFRLRTLRTANLTAVLTFGALVTLFFFASLFMQQVLGYDALKTGLAYIPLALATAVGAGAASGAITKVPAKAVLAAGLAMGAGGLLLLARLPVHAGYASGVLPPFLLVGVGLGMSFVPLQIAAAHGVGERDAGLAAGLINTSQEAGGALGVAVVSTVVFTRIGHLTGSSSPTAEALRSARADGFHRGFLVAACFTVLSLLLALAMLPAMRPARLAGPAETPAAEAELQAEAEPQAVPEPEAAGRE